MKVITDNGISSFMYEIVLSWSIKLLFFYLTEFYADLFISFYP